MARDEIPAEQAAARARYERDELLTISRALSSERDIHRLLDLILRKSRQSTGADAGSVCVVESAEDGAGLPAAGGGRSAAERRRGTVLGAGGGDRVLPFMLSQNDSLAVDFQEYRLPSPSSSGRLRPASAMPIWCASSWTPRSAKG